MKNIFLLLIVLLTIQNTAFSQISTASSAVVSEFKKSKIYVVLEKSTTSTKVKYSKVVDSLEVKTDNSQISEAAVSEFNNAMRYAMGSLWKANKFEFITDKEFEEKKFESNSYFLIIAKCKTQDKEPELLNYLIIAQGGPKAKKVEKMTWLAAIPLSFSNVSDQYYNYKIPALVQFLQNHIEYVFLNGPVEDKKLMDYYNDKSKEIKNGVLYILQEDLTAKVYDQNAIAKIYKGEVKIATQQEINDAIKNQDPNVLFLHKVGPEKLADTGMCRKFILSAKGGELLYMNEHKISNSKPEGLLESDLKQLNK